VFIAGLTDNEIFYGFPRYGQQRGESMIENMFRPFGITPYPVSVSASVAEVRW
jgi:hypothetical protein